MTQAREKEQIAFLERHAGMLCKIANKVERRFIAAGVPVERDDIIQELNMTLLIAKEKFDPSRGFTFSTYFYRAAFNQINRNMGWMIEEHHELGLMSMTVEGDDESELDLLETVASNDMTPEELAVAKSIAGKIETELSPVAGMIASMLLMPDESIVREMKAAKEHAEYARLNGMQGRMPGDMELVTRVLVKVCGIAPKVVRAARAELECWSQGGNDGYDR